MAIDYLDAPSTAEERAHRTRKEGVEYKLRVIPGSDGLLELVEVHEPNIFHEWARLMQFTGWLT
ncbi:MAG: hypothetical protein AAF993_20105 [Pseudomonadota bacterium]